MAVVHEVSQQAPCQDEIEWIMLFPQIKPAAITALLHLGEVRQATASDQRVPFFPYLEQERKLQAKPLENGCTKSLRVLFKPVLQAY